MLAERRKSRVRYLSQSVVFIYREIRVCNISHVVQLLCARIARIAPLKEASRRCAARPFHDVSFCLFRSFRFVVISRTPCEAVFLVQAWSRIFSKRSRLVCGVFVGRAPCACGQRKFADNIRKSTNIRKLAPRVPETCQYTNLPTAPSAHGACAGADANLRRGMEGRSEWLRVSATKWFAFLLSGASPHMD